jgi:hypothetical protein
MAGWDEFSKPKISGWNSGLTRARIAGHLLLTGDGKTTTPEAVRLVKVLHEAEIIGEDFDSAAYGVRDFRRRSDSRKAALIALRDKERAKVVAAVKKKFKVDIDADDFCLASALEVIEAKVGGK